MCLILINKKTDNSDAIYIGRPTPFGNPYVIGKDGDRAEVIRKYEADFDHKYNNNAEFRFCIDVLVNYYRKGITKKLSCFCHPLPCHGDVIIRKVKEIANQP